MVKKRKKISKPKARSKAKKPIKKRASKAVKRGKKSVKKSAAPKKAFELGLEKIGEVTHYFPHVKAAAVMILKNSLKAGDGIYIKGHTTDFKEKVNSMQLDRVPLEEGKKGQEVGLLVKSRVRIGDSVYKL